MTAEFILSTDAPHSISLTGPTANALGGAVNGHWNETERRYTVAFTKGNAKLLREFLRGRDVEIKPKDRKVLAFLADKVEDGEDKLDKFRWSAKLIDLVTEKVSFSSKAKEGKKTRKSYRTEWQLLHHLPLRFIDKSNPQAIDQYTLGDWVVIIGTIVNDIQYDRFRDMLKIVVQDINGKRISTTLFRQPWAAKKYHKGDEVILYGNYTEYISNQGRFPQVTGGSVDVITESIDGSLPMIPVYPQREGDKSWQLQNAIKKLLNRVVWFEDPVPEHIIKKYELMTRDQAYRALHFPANREEADRARERLAFDEFIRLQVFFSQRRESMEEAKGRPKGSLELRDRFVTSLPFTFTGAQQRVMHEITADMASPHPMYRLLQGEVGSGKTESSTAAALVAVGSGYQVAFLAPTDVLASQLYDRLLRDLDRSHLTLEVNAKTLTGRSKVKERREVTEGLLSGEVNIVVGTHAIIQKGVDFKNLGLVIIDEQHKFGNEQRTVLINNNQSNGVPDFLAMSATPIPRTTSQVVYGDMDVSIIDELPPGRIPIETVWTDDAQEAWDRVREQVDMGHQAYVVTALVEDSETLANVESATATYEMMQGIFPDLNVGLLHGKLDATTKQAVIDKFYSGETQVLVATTVVEVGVNVPNATVMTVLNANRFGIASLHQIRGRVGRGLAASYCYLVGEANNADAEERLSALVASNDGFWLAEKDLEIRGEGSLFGTRQSGMTDNFAANLREHREVLEKAKRVAKAASSSTMLREEVEYLYSHMTINA